MEKCYNYFECNKKECVVFSITDGTPCWEIEGTLCNSDAVFHLNKIKGGKTFSCKMCLYYRAMHDQLN